MSCDNIGQQIRNRSELTAIPHSDANPLLELVVMLMKAQVLTEERLDEVISKKRKRKGHAITSSRTQEISKFERFEKARGYGSERVLLSLSSTKKPQIDSITNESGINGSIGYNKRLLR